MRPSDSFQQRRIGVRRRRVISLDDETHLDAAQFNLHRNNACDQEMGGAFRRLPVARRYGQLESRRILESLRSMRSTKAFEAASASTSNCRRFLHPSATDKMNG